MVVNHTTGRPPTSLNAGDGALRRRSGGQPAYYRAVHRDSRPSRVGVFGPAIGVLGALAVATGLIAALEYAYALDNASSVYLVPVVGIAIRFGTGPAVATAIGAFLAYNFFFVDPRYTFTVARADELLTLVLLLFVGVASGRLAGLQRDRERQAVRREREARALFAISRELATSDRVTAAI